MRTKIGEAVLGAMLTIGASSCAIAAGDPTAAPEPIATHQQPISNGVASNGGVETQSTVLILGATRCTGTIIGPHQILTAAHCRPQINDTVYFYASNGYRSGASAQIVTLYRPPCVDPSQQPSSSIFLPALANWDAGMSDCNGKYADLVVALLDSYIPSGTVPALLPTSFISNGDNSHGWQVGTGLHDGGANTSYQMKYKSTKVYSSDNNDGHFLTDSSDIDPGDSGGPFYTFDQGASRMVVHGPLSGQRFEWAERAKYASVSFRIDSILNAMGEVRENNTDHRGNDYRWFSTGDVRACAVACMQDTQCAAYTHVGASNECFLKSAIDDSTLNTNAAGMTSGTKLDFYGYGDCIPAADGYCTMRCVPATCETAGSSCGDVADGCGGTLNCGSCGAGQACSTTGSCCTPGNIDCSCPMIDSSDGSCTGQCQTFTDACGFDVNCGAVNSSICQSTSGG